MTEDRTGRELTPRPDDAAVTPVLPPASTVERFSAGARAHTVGLTEERSAQIVRQSGNSRTVSILAVLIVALFVPAYWFYDIGIKAAGVEGRLEVEGNVQYVTDVSRGYALFLANCARCHGPNGEGAIGPPLNDQAKLYNALKSDGTAGAGHLNPNYLAKVLEVGGRYVCGDAKSVMPAWLQPAGPLNYREVEELIKFLTASKETSFVYDPAAAGEGATSTDPPHTQTGWRDLNYQPAPGSSPVPECWRPYYNPAFPTAPPQSGGGSITPGTAESPRVIKVVETKDLTITAEDGSPLTSIAVVDGEVVEFDVTNAATFPHNFYIGPEAALRDGVAAGLTGIPDFTSDTKKLTWTVAGADGLQFACIIPGHYGSMHGSFTLATAGDGTASPSPSASSAPTTTGTPAASGNPTGTGSPAPSSTPAPASVAP